MMTKNRVYLGIALAGVALIVFGYFFFYYPYTKIEEKMKAYYDEKIGADGRPVTWDYIDKNFQPYRIVQSDYSIMEPKYSLVYTVKDEDKLLGNAINIFYFKRSGLFSFEVEEVFKTDVLGENISFETIVELADSRNVRDMSEEELEEIENVEHAFRNNNPTPEQQAQDEEWRTPKLSWEWESPDGSDAMEIWETRNYSLGYIKIQSTGEILLEEKEYRRGMERSGGQQEKNIWLSWYGEDQIIYNNSILNCIYTTQEDLVDAGLPTEYLDRTQSIMLYDIKEREHKSIIPYEKLRQDEICDVEAITAGRDHLLLLSQDQIYYFNSDYNLVKKIAYRPEVEVLKEQYSKEEVFQGHVFITYIEYEEGILTLGFNEFHDEEDLITMEIE